MTHKMRPLPATPQLIPHLLLLHLLAWLAAPGTQSAQLHIVLAHYNESIPEVQSFVLQLLAVANIKAMLPSLHIYCKDEAVHGALAALALPAEVAVTVTHEENVGREGDSFLRYIAAHYSDLPDFVLFSQAVPSLPPAYIASMLAGHNTSIGMMALGLALNCTCKGCHQGSSATGLFAELFALSTHTVCEADFVGFFMGQFIVSKQGIQRHRPPFYVMWDGLLTAPETHWVHQRLKVEQSFPYNRNAPPVSHYLERLWAPMFGCLNAQPTSGHLFGPEIYGGGGFVCMDLMLEASW